MLAFQPTLETTKENRVVGGSSRGNEPTHYYRCQGYGHLAIQCPTKELNKDLLIEGKEKDGWGEFEYEVHELDSSPSDEDGEEVDTIWLVVVRCALT